MMDVTPEMVEAYVADQLPWMDNTDRLRIPQAKSYNDAINELTTEFRKGMEE